jgi:hypothetical protein
VTRSGRPGLIFHCDLLVWTIVANKHACPRSLSAVDIVFLALSSFCERIVPKPSEVHHRTVRPEGIAVDIAIHRCLPAKYKVAAHCSSLAVLDISFIEFLNC